MYVQLSSYVDIFDAKLTVLFLFYNFIMYSVRSHLYFLFFYLIMQLLRASFALMAMVVLGTEECDCSLDKDPVCGVDKKIYNNHCSATCEAGVDVECRCIDGGEGGSACITNKCRNKCIRKVAKI